MPRGNKWKHVTGISTQLVSTAHEKLGQIKLQLQNTTKKLPSQNKQTSKWIGEWPQFNWWSQAMIAVSHLGCTFIWLEATFSCPAASEDLVDFECFSSWAACCWLPMARSPWLLVASIIQSHKDPLPHSCYEQVFLVFVPNSSTAAKAGWQINCCVETCQSHGRAPRQGGFFIPGCQPAQGKGSHSLWRVSAGCMPQKQVLNKCAGLGSMFCCLTLSPKTLTVVCQAAGLGSLEKEGSTETSSRTSRVRWNSKEPGEKRKAGCSPWRETRSLTTLINAAVLVPKLIPSSPAAERAPLSPCSLHCHRWTGEMKKQISVWSWQILITLLLKGWNFECYSKEILNAISFWLAQLIFFQPPVGKQQKQPPNHQKQTPPQLNSASAKKTQVVPSMKSSCWHLRCAPEIPPTYYSWAL